MHFIEVFCYHKRISEVAFDKSCIWILRYFLISLNYIPIECIKYWIFMQQERSCFLYKFLNLIKGIKFLIAIQGIKFLIVIKCIKYVQNYQRKCQELGFPVKIAHTFAFRPRYLCLLFFLLSWAFAKCHIYLSHRYISWLFES